MDPMKLTSTEKNELIEKKIKSFIDQELMFTTVTVSNAIKKEGSWVRVTDVRSWLKSNFSDADLFGEYDDEVIAVRQGSERATLYKPTWKDAEDFDQTDEPALTPADVGSVLKVKRTSTTSKKKTPDPLDDVFDHPYKIISSLERIKIPGDFIKKLGWKPGDKVDADKIKASPLPSRLKVNSDYRVSIPRASIAVKGRDVKVILNTDEDIIEFEAA